MSNGVLPLMLSSVIVKMSMMHVNDDIDVKQVVEHVVSDDADLIAKMM